LLLIARQEVPGSGTGLPGRFYEDYAHPVNKKYLPDTGRIGRFYLCGF